MNNGEELNVRKEGIEARSRELNEEELSQVSGGGVHRESCLDYQRKPDYRPAARGRNICPGCIHYKWSDNSTRYCEKEHTD